MNARPTLRPARQADRGVVLSILTLVLVAGLGRPPRAAAQLTGGITLLGSTLEEIVDRHSLMVEASLFGPHLFLEDRARSVAIGGMLGFYAYEGVMGGVVASYQEGTWRPWTWGAGAGYLNDGGSVRSWSLAASAGQELWRAGRSTLLLQGALAYQHVGHPRGQHSTIALEPGGDTAFLGAVDLGHVFLHAVARARLLGLEPLLDLGWLGSWYGFEGRDYVDATPFEPGSSRSTSGSVGEWCGGGGLAIGLGRMMLFAGLKHHRGGSLFLATLGARF